jgi:hypothetical protein
MRKSTVFVSLAIAAALAGCSSGGNGGTPSFFASTAASTSATQPTPVSGTAVASANPGSTATGRTTSGSTVATTTVTTAPGKTTAPGTTTTTGTTPVTTPPTTANLNGVGPGAAVGSGPDVEVTSPARGAQLAVGPVLVTGKATHPSGVAVVTVGGAVVQPAKDGSFSQVVQVASGHSVIEVVATAVSGDTTDASIGVLAGTFLDDSQLVTNAAAARVTNDALAAAAPVVAADIQSKLAALVGQQVFNNTVSVLGDNVTTTVTVANVSVGGTVVNVVATPNGLNANIGATNLEVDVTVNVDAGTFLGIPLRLNLPLDFHFDTFTAQGLINASVQNGALMVDASNLAVNYSPTLVADLIGQNALNAINSALSGIGSVLGVNLTFDEVSIANSLINTIWNGGLRKTTDTQIASMITAAGNTGLPVQILNYTANIQYLPTAISIDSNGLSLTTDLNLTLAAPDVHTSLGSVVSQGAVPVLTATTGVQLAVNEDTLNRAFEVAWRKGAIDKTLDVNILSSLNAGLTAANLTLLVPALNAIVPAGAALQIGLAPQQAPLVTFQTGNTADLAITELDVELGFVDGSGNYTKLLVLAINCDVPTGFNLNGTGNQARTLTLSPGTPKFTFDIRYSIIAGIPKTTIENALSFILPPLVQFAGASLLPPIPLPEANVAGLSPTVNTLATDGAQGTFLRADISVN